MKYLYIAVMINSAMIILLALASARNSEAIKILADTTKILAGLR